MNRSVVLRGRLRGFTVVEILVSLGIIGLLMAILVPAVQSSRGAARLTECRSRLRELGLAVHGYEGVHRRLPETRSQSVSRGQSGLVSILPQLDQSTLFEELVRNPVTSMTCFPALESSPLSPAVLRCPADFAERGTNYRFNCGSDAVNVKQQLISYRGVSLSIVTDGLSQTALMSESLISPADSHGFSEPDLWYAGLNSSISSPSNDDVRRLCELALTNPVPNYQLAGHYWTVYGILHTQYNHVVGPNAKIANCDLYSRRMPEPFCTGEESLHGIMPARSRHVGGVNLLLLDGSVRFVANQIDLGLWQAVSTINDGETTSQF